LTVLCGLGSVMCQLVIGREFSLSTVIYIEDMKSCFCMMQSERPQIE